MKNLLIVFAGGLDKSLRHFRPLLDELRKEPELVARDAQFLEFDQATYRMGRRPLSSFSEELAAKINERWIVDGGFEEIILIGHSVGGLLLREAYLIAFGELAQPRLSWAAAVHRIVLLAAPNRGLSKLSKINWLGDRLVRLFLPWMHFTYQDIMDGSVFITNLRLRWIRHFGTHRATVMDLPQVVQLRGEKDTTVQPDDSLDILAFPEGGQLTISGADHFSIAILPVKRGGGGGTELTETGRERYRLLRNALLGGPSALGIAQSGTAVSRSPPSFDRVVFIFHGIRARNVEGWLTDLAKKISAQDDRCKVFRPNYGYFSALRFILPSVRRRNIRMLLDEYSQRLAENPDATFHFIGHSNGTYMLGRSLQQIPAMRFERVVLAGSVLPTDIFAGNSRIRNQVTAVRSDGARYDWPVGILCRILRKTLFVRDVGTAGYDGFDGAFVQDHRYHAGGHGDMFTTENIKSMVAFVLGTSSRSVVPNLPAESSSFRLISQLSPTLAGVLLISLILYPAFPGVQQDWMTWALYLGVGAAIGAVILDAA
jgi:alpha-beta hydrolase superfamily lysophospholipase